MDNLNLSEGLIHIVNCYSCHLRPPIDSYISSSLDRPGGKALDNVPGRKKGQHQRRYDQQ